MESLYFLVFFYTYLLGVCICFDPLSIATGTGIAAAAYFSWGYINCKLTECCDKPYIYFNNMSSLESNLKHNLFGQHLAKIIILKTLKGYLRNPNPKKALVMSFHGPTGTGKNFVAGLIANSFYKNGVKSKFVHQYIANKDFPHAAEVSKYQDLLREHIQTFSKQCDRNLFIFDEVDKMPPGTLDALKPFIDYYEDIEGVDYRKNIFIFLSNAGSNAIIETMLNFWKEGQDRERITMKHIEPLINKGAFNERGGFQFSELLSSALIDVYVPFLPLEKIHVRKCIAAEIKHSRIRVTDKLVTDVAEELTYIPPEIELYAASGCKRIKQKIDVAITD